MKNEALFLDTTINYKLVWWMEKVLYIIYSNFIFTVIYPQIK